MALQGTLETFSVPEVLRLLSGTNKTGLLALEGDRGVGNVWLRDGRIVSAISDHEQGDHIEAVLFDLLRFTDGSFVFESGSEPDEPTTDEVDVDDALAEAERLLDEWREIESVVPSLDVYVRLVPELAAESVTITAAEWHSVALVGSGLTVGQLGARHAMGEFDASRLVHGLVEAGLVAVSDDAPPEVTAAPTASDEPLERWLEDDDEPTLVDHDLSHDEVAHLGQNLAGFVANGVDEPGPVTAASLDDARVADEPHDDPQDELLDDHDVDGGGEPEVIAPDDGFAAPAGPGTDALGVEGDEEINRNLLLKFLSSAKN